MIRFATKTMKTTTTRKAHAGARRRLLLTAAAALSTTSLLNGPPMAVHGLVVSPTPATTTTTTRRTALTASRAFATTTTTSLSRPLAVSGLPTATTRTTESTRLYSGNNKNDEEKGGFLSKIGNAVKSILPSSWFQSEEEKKVAIQRQRAREELSGGLTELLKDAPLPIRMFGKMMAPLISTAVSSLAQTMAEQLQTVDEIMADARKCLLTDDNVANLLGEPIQVSAPFSQSSSTTSINGQTATRVEVACSVTGSRGSAVARVSATGQGVQQILLQTAAGRTIAVSLSKSGSVGRRSTFSPSSSSSSSDDNIIEAEIIEKKTKQ